MGEGGWFGGRNTNVYEKLNFFNREGWIVGHRVRKKLKDEVEFWKKNFLILEGKSFFLN